MSDPDHPDETERGRDERPGEADVYAPEDEGRQYRATAYIPVAYENLDSAPDSVAYPDSGTGDRHRLLDLPRVPRLSHVLGPSAIMLGASLGSGETLFWPLLIAENGWAIYWAFWVGVLTQFVVNTEIQRWTLATGESVFRALDRLHRGWPWFFLLAGFASLGWPGWAASAAKVGAAGLGLEGQLAFGLTGWETLGIALMVLIWLSYQVTPLMYNVVERFQLVLVLLSILSTVVLFGLIRPFDQLQFIPAGAVSFGAVPTGRNVAVFLGALAYAGAGGYLNLSQSLWIREKGYGMGRYQGRIKNPLIGEEPEPVQRDGFTFAPTVTNLRRWRGWWKLAQLEHFVTFVAGVLVAATIMMAISASFGIVPAEGGAVAMWLQGIVPELGPLGGRMVYLVLFLALFTTEYAIVESFVRNSADIVYESYGRAAGWSLPRIFWLLLTVFAAWGVLVLAAPIPIENPFGLLVLGASMSGVMMWPYIALTLIVNTARLPEHTQPGWIRTVAMWWATAFFGYFSVLLLGRTLSGDLGVTAFAIAPAGVGSGPGGYALWALYLGVQAYTMYRTATAKLDAANTVENAEEASGSLR